MKRSNRSIVLVLFTFFLIGIMTATSVSAQGEGFSETFDDPTLPGWERTDNVVVVDAALRIEGTGFAFNPTPLLDANISFRFRYEGEGHLEIHYLKSETSSYILLLTPEIMTLIKDMDGQQIEMGAVDVGLAPSDWHELAIDRNGSEHRIVLDSSIELGGFDEQDSLPGGLMFHNFGDSMVEFDDLIVASGAGQPPVEEPPPPEEFEPTIVPEDHLSNSELSWVRLGGPPGGLGYDIRYNFDDPDIWYVTDTNGGVHISRDNGLTWEQSNTGISPVGGPSGDGVPVFSLTVDPHDPQTIWIGTTSGQIYKSTDGGSTWVEKDKGVLIEHDVTVKFRGFTIDPRTSDIVYAMAELLGQWESSESTTGGVVYKTVDGGENWTVIWDGGIPSSLARYLWIDPRDPDVLYVSTGIFDSSAVGEGDFSTNPNAFGGLGVLKTTDGGKTWRVLDKDNGLDFLYIGSLYMHPDDPDVLLAAAGKVSPDPAVEYLQQQGHSPMGVYRTSDGGETWEQVLEPAEDILVQAFSSVEICPSDHDIVYAGSETAVYRSEDSGLSWTLVSGGPQGWGPEGVCAGWPIDMQCDPRDPDRVFANNYMGGNFLSEDGGKTWQNVSSGYSGAQLINVAVDPFNPARVFASGRSGGWYSQDGGQIWTGTHNPGETGSVGGVECGSVAVDPVREDHVLLACITGFYEWDGQENRWALRPIPPDIHPGIAEIEFAPSDSRIVYAVSANHNSMIHTDFYDDGRGVMVSNDGGTSWQEITGDLFNDAILTDVSIDPKDAKVVYVASQIGLFKSTDGGSNWVSPSNIFDAVQVRTVAVNPDDSNEVMVGTQYKGLFISEDGGSSWRQLTAGLEPNTVYRDIVFDPTSPDTIYIADIMSGVYMSVDGGENWTKITQGMTNRAVTSLSISSDGLHLYAGTSGGGVFRLDLNGQLPVSSGSSQMDEPGGGESSQEEDQSGTSEDGGGISLPCLGGALPLLMAGVLVLRKPRR